MIKVNPRAKVILKKAYSLGMDDEDIASKCGVSLGSVKRWYSIGRADAEKIKPLEALVGFIQLNECDTADALIEIYKKRKKRFRITKSQFLGISGRSILRLKFLELVTESLMDRGYHFLEIADAKEGETGFLVIRERTLSKLVPSCISNKEIEEYLSLNIEAELWEEDGD